MAVNSATSFILSSIFAIILFSGMQMYKPLLTSSPMFIILGGYVGSIMFILILTAVGNLEATLFGGNFQVKLVEIVASLLISLIASGMVHRICVTTCLIFSLIGLYYVNKISQKTYYSAPATPAAPLKKKRT